MQLTPNCTRYTVLQTKTFASSGPRRKPRIDVPALISPRGVWGRPIRLPTGKLMKAIPQLCTSQPRHMVLDARANTLDPPRIHLWRLPINPPCRWCPLTR